MKRKRIFEEQEQSPTQKLNKRLVPPTGVIFASDTRRDKDAENQEEVDTDADISEHNESNNLEPAEMADAEGAIYTCTFFFMKASTNSCQMFRILMSSTLGRSHQH